MKFSNNKKRIYLDYASATPVHKEVAVLVTDYQGKKWANPSSLHKEGEEARGAIEEARTRIAKILNCKSSEIYFASGATEALNIAVLGVAASHKNSPPHIITSAIEHSSILETVKHLVRKGAEATFLSPNRKGLINPASVEKEIKENTALLAFSHANSEIGVLQPIREINKKHSILLVDASQSFLYENISFERLGADIIVIDGIKVYGPRGIAVLAIKDGTKIEPVTFGGGQERGLRPGTEDAGRIAGLALALEIGAKMREEESKRLTQLHDWAIDKILKEIPGSSLNGSRNERLPNNINICFPGQDSEFLVIKLDTCGFAVSAASACQNISGDNSSYVLEAIGKKECAGSSLRITLGRQTRKSDLDKLISVLKKIIK